MNKTRNFLAWGALLAIAAPLVFAATTEVGSYGHGIQTVRETNTSTTSSTSWIDVPGATTNISIPTNHDELIIARFTAESSCYNASGYCQVRILVNGVEMQPAAGTNYAFDSSDAGGESVSSWESHAMERSLGVSGPCSGSSSTKQVKVQYRVSNSSVTFWLDDWHLAVETFHAGDFVC